MHNQLGVFDGRVNCGRPREDRNRRRDARQHRAGRPVPLSTHKESNDDAKCIRRATGLVIRNTKVSDTINWPD
jgi:hypothetical protein